MPMSNAGVFDGKHPPLFLLASLTVIGCSHAQPEPAPTKAPEVLVVQPVSQEVTDTEDFTGRTEAVQSVDIRARVSGYLDKVLFQEGMDVKEGDVLCEIDPRTYKADLDKAEANLVQAEAHLKRLEADYRRAVELLPKKAMSREEFDKIAGDRAEAEAAVGVARASRDRALLDLKFTKVTAPFSGRIGRKMIDPGNLVKADETILTNIVALDPIHAVFDVDERTLLHFRRLLLEGKVKSAREAKLPVFLGLADEEGYPHQGTINFVDNKIDPMTGTLRVRGVFANTDRLFSPGMFVRIRVLIGPPHRAILIPERALGTDQGQKFVFVVNDQDEVVYRKVKIGALKDGNRVIDSGLQPGERVIVSGQQRVRAGVKVEPKPAPADLTVAAGQKSEGRVP